LELEKIVDWFGRSLKISTLDQGQYGIDFWDSNYEPDQAKIFIECIKYFPDFTFIDCGAAIGAYTLPALAYGRNVIAIEPEKNVFRILKENVMLNNFQSTFELLNTALIDKHNNRGKFIGDASTMSHNDYTDFESTLIDIAKDFQNKIIKIDIEGAEWPILKNKATINSLLNSRNIIFLAPHIGFDSSHRSAKGKNLRFKWGVVLEIMTLINLLIRFKFIYEIGVGKLKLVSIFNRKRFYAHGWPNSLLISNDSEVILKLKNIVK
jgi:FkbM family methyltransferase